MHINIYMYINKKNQPLFTTPVDRSRFIRQLFQYTNTIKVYILLLFTYSLSFGSVWKKIKLKPLWKLLCARANTYTHRGLYTCCTLCATKSDPSAVISPCHRFTKHKITIDWTFPKRYYAINYEYTELKHVI